MPKVIARSEVTIIMDRAEAVWLKNVFQNPLWTNVEGEPKHDRDFRKSFWDALEAEGV